MRKYTPENKNLDAIREKLADYNLYDLANRVAQRKRGGSLDFVVRKVFWEVHENPTEEAIINCLLDYYHEKTTNQEQITIQDLQDRSRLFFLVDMIEWLLAIGADTTAPANKKYISMVQQEINKALNK